MPPITAAQNQSPYTTQQLQQYAIAVANGFNLNPAAFLAQITAESSWNPFIVSKTGAQGIAQFEPGTAGSGTAFDPFDPFAAIQAMGQYMRNLIDHNGGSLPLALAAYNAGQGAVDAHGGIPPYAETQSYVQKIMAAVGQGIGAVTGAGGMQTAGSAGDAAGAALAKAAAALGLGYAAGAGSASVGYAAGALFVGVAMLIVGVIWLAAGNVSAQIVASRATTSSARAITGGTSRAVKRAAPGIAGTIGSALSKGFATAAEALA